MAIPPSIKKRECVVIDTNILRAELLLKSPTGMSLVYTLGRQGNKLGLPEVIEKEIERQIVEVGIDAVREIERPSRIIATLTGDLPPQFPNEETFVKITERRLQELEPIIVRIPFTLEHARAALEMVVEKLPPNGEKNQQFKDSAIWQSILQLATHYKVHFVTNDRKFYADRNDSSQGLAPNLRADCNRLAASVTAYFDLKTCLRALTRVVPKFDKSVLESLLMHYVLPQLSADAARHRFVLGEVIDTKIDAFQTDQDDRIAIDYEVVIAFALSNQIKEGLQRSDCRARVLGSCFFQTSRGEVSGHLFRLVEFSWKYVDSPGKGLIARAFDCDDDSIPFLPPQEVRTFP